ncbi:hypothetical protein GCM10023213_21630 [Prosthecobacter algae]|uniref:Glycoside hydrolase family 42 N-terminal domain-containing protein n=1 Tax=Prosthecobacter algae TaxID=1144682 RepID=A0ABP9P7Y7_9BACT
MTQHLLCRLLLLVWVCVPHVAKLNAQTPGEAQSVADSYNYLLGTQAIGGKYQFTEQDPLVEAAKEIRAMGATTMKFDLRPKPTQYPHIHSLVELVSQEPAHREVLDMPFAYYQMWAESFAGTSWKKGFSNKDAEAEYREIYDQTAYLLKTYTGSGKTFYLGHWEGDNLLRGDISEKADAMMTPEKVQGMISWLNTRQRAVDDAKRETKHEKVQVWHYTEINHPTISLKKDRPSLVNQVLPFVPVDFVSYSAYDVTNEPKAENIKTVLDYIESKLTPKPEITGKRVFIGEYGYTVSHNGMPHRTPQEQNDLSLITIQAAVEWGCPFILYWELYNNEVEAGGQHRGYWMIDDKGVKQPIHETHRRYYAWAREFVSEAYRRTGQAPSEKDFRQAVADYFKAAAPKKP